MTHGGGTAINFRVLIDFNAGEEATVCGVDTGSRTSSSVQSRAALDNLSIHAFVKVAAVNADLPAYVVATFTASKHMHKHRHLVARGST